MPKIGIRYTTKFPEEKNYKHVHNDMLMHNYRYLDDSTNKAKIENIFLLKLKVIFLEIFFMEFIVSIYLKVYTWLCPQKMPPTGQGGEQFVHDDGQGSLTMDIYCPRWWTYEPRRNAIKNGYPQDEWITTMLQRRW